MRQLRLLALHRPLHDFRSFSFLRSSSTSADIDGEGPLAVLGLPPTATLLEARLAYYRKARLLHPDIHTPAKNNSGGGAAGNDDDLPLQRTFSELTRALELALADAAAAGQVAQQRLSAEKTRRQQDMSQDIHSIEAQAQAQKDAENKFNGGEGSASTVIAAIGYGETTDKRRKRVRLGTEADEDAAQQEMAASAAEAVAIKTNAASMAETLSSPRGLLAAPRDATGGKRLGGLVARPNDWLTKRLGRSVGGGEAHQRGLSDGSAGGVRLEAEQSSPQRALDKAYSSTGHTSSLDAPSALLASMNVQGDHERALWIANLEHWAVRALPSRLHRVLLRISWVPSVHEHHVHYRAPQAAAERFLSIVPTLASRFSLSCTGITWNSSKMRWVSLVLLEPAMAHAAKISRIAFESYKYLVAGWGGGVVRQGHARLRRRLEVPQPPSGAGRWRRCRPAPAAGEWARRCLDAALFANNQLRTKRHL